MSNSDHLAILKEGVERWNSWRKENPDVTPHLPNSDLRGDWIGDTFCQISLRNADLRGADLRKADLRGLDLCAADLSGARLNAANFSKAELRGANLAAADLRYADLSRADLRESDLAGANLQRTIFRGAALAGARFLAARVGQTDFADVDLSAAIGLETLKHEYPSTIGIDTIYKSRGKIPEAFLRGCGVPDEFVRYIGSMEGRPIEFYSCFISYSTRDQEFADKLYTDLQSKGVRCWFAPHDIKGGRKLYEQLDEAIRLHDKLLLILSEASMNSDWVGTEIANARERESREGKQMLFPITIVTYEKVKSWKLFDADRGKDSAREIREYFIPDFSNWKEHDSYQQALQRLVKDLKAGTGE